MVWPAASSSCLPEFPPWGTPPLNCGPTNPLLSKLLLLGYFVTGIEKQKKCAKPLRRKTDFLKSDLCESDYVKVVCNFCFHYSQSALFLVLVYMSMHLLNIYFGCFFPPRCFLVLFYFVLFYCLFECIILSYIRPFPCNYNTYTLNIFPPYPSALFFPHPISSFCAYYPPLTQTHMYTHARTHSY